MRFIVIRTKLDSEGKLGIEGLTSLVHKASGVIGIWLDTSTAKVDYVAPEKSDLLCFSEDEIDELEQNLEAWGIANEFVRIIAVEGEFISLQTEIAQ